VSNIAPISRLYQRVMVVVVVVLFFLQRDERARAGAFCFCVGQISSLSRIKIQDRNVQT